jgi:protoheme IX farnesyltransferase
LLQGDRASVLLRPTRGLSLRLFFDLFKLRIGLVIGFTALAGLAVASGRSLPAWRVFALGLAVTLASAAAGAFNQIVERGLDAGMRRTRNRPFVSGQLTAGPAWHAAIAATGAAGVALAAFALNLTTAIYTFLGAFTYAVVYTMWLKRRTWWNIVIGGLAGSFAVLAGAAAVSPQALEPLPLAFAYHDDYAAAKVPMLPVVVGDARAARAVLAGSALLVAASLVPALLGMGWLYLVTAVGAGAYLLVKSAQLARAPSARTAIANFHASLFYLALLLAVAILDAGLRL